MFSFTILIVLFSFTVLFLIFKLQKQKIYYEKLLNTEIKIARQDGKKRATAVQFGKTIEHFVPFMEDFPIPPRDVTFIGMPIDFIGFSKTNSKEQCTVHFIEVKTGNSFLLKKQQNIKNAIQNGRVEWHEIKLNTKNKLDI